MSADLVLAALSLTKDIAGLIRNVPRNKKQLEELNNRCIVRLNTLNDASMSLEDPTISGFLEEMHMILQGIVERLRRRRGMTPLAALFQQSEIEGWIAEQNLKIDDTFRTMIVQILVTHARQMTETRARQEHDLHAILSEIRSHFQSEAALDSQLVGEALDLVTQLPEPGTFTGSGRLRSSRHSRRPPQSLPLNVAARVSFEEPLPATPQRGIPAASSSQITPQTVLPAEAILKKESGKIYGNSLGLMNHLLETDDENFKHVMLRTYLDYASSHELFDVIERRFREVKPEMGHFVKRFRIIEVVVAWLEVVPPESNLFHRVREFASATQSNLIPDHKQRILNAIKARHFRPVLPSTRGLTVEPVEPGELAIALTHIEDDLYKEVRLIDYLRHSGGLPSHLDTVLSNHDKMIRWVKYSVLRHDEMRDRAAAMKRFVKAGRECLTRRNYNSMAAIARALDWKSKPMSDFPRTLGILSKKTRASFEQIVQLVDPDDDYNAYRGAKSSSAGNHIPWFIAELDEMNRYLSQYPRTVDNLINFERYQRLASRTPQDPLPTQVEGTRQQRHIAHLRNQFTDNIFDDEAENQRRRKLKIKEDEDYRNRRPELKALGFA